MAARLVGRQVEVSGLASRPELNGRRGIAQSFNEDVGRYNVDIGGEVILALKPANLRVVEQAAPHHAGQAGFALPWGVDPKYYAVGLLAVLTMGFGVPLLTAALLAGVALLAHKAVRREGGVLPAARSVGRKAADGLQRLTGRPASPAQAAFVLVALSLLLWWYVLPSGGGRGRSDFGDARWRRAGAESGSHSRGSNGYGRGSSYHPRDSMRGGYDEYSSSYSGLGAGWDFSFVLGVGMLGLTVWNMGGGGRAEGWSLGQLLHRLQNMDLWQMMMLMNLVQQVLGGGRRGGYYGRRRGMYF